MRPPKPVSPRIDRAVYKQVADDLRKQIQEGDLRPGENLPAEADLGHGYAVGMTTIRSALAILRAEGLVITERGKGSRVRTSQEPLVVVLPPSGRAHIRTATEAECISLELPSGALVVEVQDDEETKVVPALGTIIQGGAAT